VVSYRSALLLAKNSRSIPDQFRALRGLAQSYLASRQYLQASKTLNEHLTLAQTEGNRREELISLRLSAQLYKTTGQWIHARSFYERAIALATALGETQEEAFLRNDLAQFIYYRGAR
jgi:tetratricopeptide (TPR) repeat protein